MIDYKIDFASSKQIEEHLRSCNDDFIPPLDRKVEISRYSVKLNEKAVTFEAWKESHLAGLVAIYLNDLTSKIGFISNVSVLKSEAGKGIGTSLLQKGIEYARNKNFNELRLEVSRNNDNAIRLYEKFGFTTTTLTDESRFMSRIL